MSRLDWSMKQKDKILGENAATNQALQGSASFGGWRDQKTPEFSQPNA
jgi:hypothetical protein